jgi:adenine/guanine phosphoribosyltransferase-like PRPP-binding protein
VAELGFVIELLDLPGRKRIEDAGYRAHALCGFSEAES